MENLGGIPESRDISDIYGLAGGGSEDAQAAEAPATPAQVFQDTEGQWQEGTPVDGKPGTFDVGGTEFEAQENSTTFTVGQTVIGTTDEKNHAGTLERVTGDTATIKDTKDQETSVPASTLKPILSRKGVPLNVGDKVVEIHDPNQEPKTIGTIDNKGWVTLEGDPNMKISSKDLALKKDIQEEAHADDIMSQPESEVESSHSDDSGVLPGFERMQAAQASSPPLTSAGKDMYAVMAEYGTTSKEAAPPISAGKDGTTSKKADPEETASRTNTAVLRLGKDVNLGGKSPAGHALIGNVNITDFPQNVSGPTSVEGTGAPDAPPAPPASSLAGRVSKANPEEPKTNADKTSAKIKNGFKKLAKSPRFQNILKGGGAVEGFNSQLTGLSCILFPSRASQLIGNFNKYRDQIMEWGNRKTKHMQNLNTPETPT